MPIFIRKNSVIMLFTSDNTFQHCYLSAVFIGIVIPLCCVVDASSGDKESGIDSDDSGTETFNSTDNVSNLSGHSAFNIVSISEVSSTTTAVRADISPKPSSSRVCISTDMC